MPLCANSSSSGSARHEFPEEPPGFWSPPGRMFVFLSASGLALLSPASSVPGQSGRDREAPWGFSAVGGEATAGAPLPSLLQSRDRAAPLKTSEHPLMVPRSSPGQRDVPLGAGTLGAAAHFPSAALCPVTPEAT